MPAKSAGLLIYRAASDRLEVLLVHPGGPFWARKDEGAWSIPKGLIEPGENELSAARRKSREELGADVDGTFERLGEYRQPGGKVVVVWAVEADPAIERAAIVSNTFRMEWPPKSGLMKEFPEVDRASWFGVDEAEKKILKGLSPMLRDLVARRAQ